MNINLPRPVYFLMTYIFATILYWPLLNGTPIWDDWTFWFEDIVMNSDYSYFEFWKKFSWPLSNSLQKVLLSIFDKNYTAYHVINLLLHFTNSFLVYLMAKKLKFISPNWLFCLFLLSPVCVISVGWLIQFKTLLAFFFGISSFITFLYFFENKKWIYLSWFFFFLSVAAKSTLITLPIIMIAMCFKKVSRLRCLLIIPFFLISAVGTYRILNSPITKSEVNLLTVSEKDGRPNLIPSVELNEDRSKVQKVKKDFFVMRIYYYFWQAIAPVDNAPVKGPYLESHKWIEYTHLFFLACTLGVFWKSKIIFYLIAGHILLFPFLGIIPAPFMNVTWVSDQHLYAVLPVFLCFWIFAFESIKFRYNWFILLIISVLFSYKTYQSSFFYKNEIAFYKESIRSNPTNLAISYNLAFAYLRSGNISESLKVLENVYDLSQYMPELKDRRFYDDLMILYYSLKYPRESSST